MHFLPTGKWTDKYFFILSSTEDSANFGKESFQKKRERESAALLYREWAETKISKKPANRHYPGQVMNLGWRTTFLELKCNNEVLNRNNYNVHY